MANGSRNWAMVSSDTRKQSMVVSGKRTNKNMPEGSGVFVGLNTLTFMHEGVSFGKPDKKGESINALLSRIEIDESVLNRLNFYGLFGGRAQKTGVIPPEWRAVKAIYVRGNVRMPIIKYIKGKFLQLLVAPQSDSTTPNVPLEPNPAIATLNNNAYLNSPRLQEAAKIGQNRNLIFSGTYSDADLSISDRDAESASLYLRYINVLLMDDNTPIFSNFVPDNSADVMVRGKKVRAYPVAENEDFSIALHTTLGWLNNYRWNGQGQEYKNLTARKGGNDGSDFWTVTVSSWKSTDLPDNVIAVLPDRIRGIIERSDRVRVNYVFSYQNKSILNRIINLHKSNKFSDAFVMFAGKATADLVTKNGAGTRRKYINPYKSEATGEKIVDLNVRQGTFVTIRNFN